MAAALNYLPDEFNLIIVRGDAWSEQFKVAYGETQTGTQYVDLTGKTIVAEVRTERVGGTLLATITCELTDSYTIAASLSSGDTATLPARGYWDLKIDDKTYLTGQVLVDTYDIPDPYPVDALVLRGEQGVQGIQGPAMANSGTIAAIPAASSESPGFLYYATDEGVQYVKVGALGSGSWTPISLGARELALVQPSTDGSAVTLTNATTWYGIPELTTGSMTYNSSKRLVVSGDNLCFAMSAGTASEVTYAIQYNKNGGATWYYAGGSALDYADGFGFLHPHNIRGIIPNAGTGTLANGDTFTVRIAVYRSGGVSRTITQKFIEALGALPYLQVLEFDR